MLPKTRENLILALRMLQLHGSIDRCYLAGLYSPDVTAADADISTKYVVRSIAQG